MAEVVKLPHVAVCLAAYNGRRWLSEQIGSILCQRNVAVTVFISVDQSTDGTEELIDDLKSTDHRLVVLPHGHHFGGAASNFFRLISDVDFRSFDYVALADQDDIWLETKLSRACNALNSGEYDIYSSDVIAFWSDGKKRLVKKSFPQRRFDYYFESAGPGCSYVFSRIAIDATKAFLQKIGEAKNKVALHDWLFYAYCRRHGYKWLIDDQAYLLYRQHDSNQVGMNTGLSAFIKRICLVRKKWYLNQVMTIAELVAPGFKETLKDKMFLVRNFRQLRRRPRDQFVLLGMLLFNLF